MNSVTFGSCEYLSFILCPEKRSQPYLGNDRHGM